ncbi:hypothetical protein L1077_18395 [Pseudoalteromonas luteoviolacea]|uniref:hypothetical protein n=1 Tax=Pseudoalteromonas luteoviolacea TaxID=43657 RepID=UPI001F1E1BB0|nr:hypothetical protein [Pseudoalteromonas luteoviolacea]MCF6441410.1 hypothetical protein [Pseudoalteromonas luteoviolacea]
MNAIKAIALTAVAAVTLTLTAVFTLGHGNHTLQAMAFGDQVIEYNIYGTNSLDTNFDDTIGHIEMRLKDMQADEHYVQYKVDTATTKTPFIAEHQRIKITYHRNLTATLCGKFGGFVGIYATDKDEPLEDKCIAI